MRGANRARGRFLYHAGMQSPDPALEPDGTYVHRLMVRYGETDQMGRAHHANYLLYFEEARTAMMRALGVSYAETEKRGIGLPVRQTAVRYRNAAFYEDELAVVTRIERVGPASVTFTYRIVRPSDDLLIATGSTELASIRMAGPDTRLTKLGPELEAVFAAHARPE